MKILKNIDLSGYLHVNVTSTNYLQADTNGFYYSKENANGANNFAFGNNGFSSYTTTPSGYGSYVMQGGQFNAYINAGSNSCSFNFNTAGINIFLNGGGTLGISSTGVNLADYTSTGNLSLYSQNSVNISAGGSGSALIKTLNLTADRIFQFPNVNGTLALITDIPTTANYIANQTASIQTGNYRISGYGQVDQLGIGGAITSDVGLRYTRSLTGSANPAAIYINSSIQSDVTGSALGYSTFISTAAATFTTAALYHYLARQGSIGAGSVITSQYGYHAQNTLIGATNNYGFYGDIPTGGNNNWNIYANGTAPNFMRGRLGLNSLTLTTTSFRNSLLLTGGTVAYANYSDGTIQSDVTSGAVYYTTNGGTAAASFTLSTLTHYQVSQNALGAGSAVTSQNGFLVLSNMTGATNNYGFRGSLAASTGRWNIYMDGTAYNYLAGRLGIGTSTVANVNLFNTLTITGGTVAYGNYVQSQVQSDVTASAIYYASTSSTAATTFTLSNLIHYQASQGAFGAGSTVTQQVGFNVLNNMTGAGTNLAFRGQIALGTNCYNLYMDGTANNYLAGSLGIGIAPTEKLHVVGNVKATKFVDGTSGYTMCTPTSTAYTGFFTDTGLATAAAIKAGSLVLSTLYSDVAPTNGLFVKGGIQLSKVTNTTAAISWYSPSYKAWTTYMAQAGTTTNGVNGNITAPTGSLVTSWALRNYIENTSGFGFTWEVGTSNTANPSLILAEMEASTGNFRLASLSGSGSRMVVADSTGKLTTQAIPSTGVNIYNSNGTLTSDRVITGGGYFFGITGVSNYEVDSSSSIYMSSQTDTQLISGGGFYFGNVGGGTLFIDTDALAGANIVAKPLLRNGTLPIQSNSSPATITGIPPGFSFSNNGSEDCGYFEIANTTGSQQDFVCAVTFTQPWSNNCYPVLTLSNESAWLTYGVTAASSTGFSISVRKVNAGATVRIYYQIKGY